MIKSVFAALALLSALAVSARSEAMTCAECVSSPDGCGELYDSCATGVGSSPNIIGPGGAECMDLYSCLEAQITCDYVADPECYWNDILYGGFCGSVTDLADCFYNIGGLGVCVDQFYAATANSTPWCTESVQYCTAQTMHDVDTQQGDAVELAICYGAHCRAELNCTP